MKKTFNIARANLAHSQSLMDRFHAPQEMAQQNSEMPTEPQQEVPQAPVKQAPAIEQTPPQPAPETQAPDPKTTQDTIKELSDTIRPTR